MIYRTIKDTELNLSVLGTGCWAFGGGDYWGPLDQYDATDVVHASVAHGINYFDTAEVYNEGRSETSLGIAIKGIRRSKLVIGTKISPSNAYRDTLIKHCEDSLRRLQTDYIDIYMIHWPIHPHSIRHFTDDEAILSTPPSIHEAFEAMQILQKSGKIRYAGLSNFSTKRLKEDIPAGAKVAVNELPYNLLCRSIEYDTLPYCMKNGIGVIGYMTLLQGILTGKYATLADVPEWQRRTRHFSYKGSPKSRHGENGFEQETAAALKGIEEVSLKYRIKMSELASAFVVNSGITCALVGARNIRQLEENIKALEAPVTSEIMQELDQVTSDLKEKLGNHLDYYESIQNDRT
jgi:aryl-alcohol dehydrogenase-like predicted oxidoreductase